MKKLYPLFIIFLFLTIANCANSQTLPAGFTISNIASGWDQPLGVAPSKDGKKIFVWEKGGKVYVCNWDTTTQQYIKKTNPVIDISAEVGNWRDHGLNGFAIDPDFDNNGFIYLLYVVDRHHLMNYGTGAYNAGTNEYYNATIARVTKYKTNTDVNNQVLADLASRTILIGETRQTGIPVLHESHSAGSLVFAADGTLLVSAGDGSSYDGAVSGADLGSDPGTYYIQALADGIIRPEENVGAFRAQLINSFNGKILRINPTNGNGIENNPFYLSANPRAPQSRVWAMGLRNPFRISTKPNSGSANPETGDIGEIFVGDVGWFSYEELNIIDKAGYNCGWPLFEGHNIIDNYYDHTVQNKDVPNPLYGINGCNQPFFYFQDLIKQATADNNTTVYNPCSPLQPIILPGSANRFFHHRPAIDWQHGVDIASVGTFVGNNAATATIGTTESGVTGVSFRGNCTVGGAWYTGTAFPPAYRNTFLFGEYENGLNTDWIKVATMNSATTLKTIEPFVQGLEALVFITENPLDGSILCIDLGAADPVKKISYGGSQPPVVKLSANKISGTSPLSVNFTGSNSYDPEGGIIGYTWDFGDATTSTAPNPPAHIFTSAPNTPAKFVVKLTVKDNVNLTATDSIVISVNNTPPVVNITSPAKNSGYNIGSDTIYALQASVTDAEHINAELKYEWQTILRHNTHEHAEPIDTNRVTSSVISRIGCNGDFYYFFIKLKVTDPAGLSTTDSSKIFPLCPGDVVFPLVIDTFTVSNQENINYVKWTTLARVSHKYFELERSNANDQHFEMINQQPWKNDPDTQYYAFDDITYLSGINFYRLKMIDVDGTFSYSKTIKIVNGLETNGDIRITPNPVLKEFTISGKFPAAGAVSIRIMDATGRIVKQLKDNVSTVSTTIPVTNLERLQNGTYYVEIKHKDFIKTLKFIKLKQ